MVRRRDATRLYGRRRPSPMKSPNGSTSRSGFTQILGLKADHFPPRKVPCPLSREEQLLDFVGFDHIAGKPGHVLRKTVVRPLRIDDTVLLREQADMRSRFRQWSRVRGHGTASTTLDQ